MKALKKQLSIVCVVMCLFAANLNVFAAEKWQMPTNIQWTEDWMAQWTVTPSEERVETYDIELRKNGGEWVTKQLQ